MELIQLSGYTLEEKMEIAKTHLLVKQLKNHGLTPEDIELPDEVISKVITGYTREAGNYYYFDFIFLEFEMNYNQIK